MTLNEERPQPARNNTAPSRQARPGNVGERAPSKAAAAWAEHVDLVERLLGLAEAIEPTRPARRSSAGESIAARVEDLATRLADDARVKAYEIVGNRERAVSIMERRLGD